MRERPRGTQINPEWQGKAACEGVLGDELRGADTDHTMKVFILVKVRPSTTGGSQVTLSDMLLRKTILAVEDMIHWEEEELRIWKKKS